MLLTRSDPLPANANVRNHRLARNAIAANAHNRSGAAASPAPQLLLGIDNTRVGRASTQTLIWTWGRFDFLRRHALTARIARRDDERVLDTIDKISLSVFRQRRSTDAEQCRRRRNVAIGHGIAACHVYGLIVGRRHTLPLPCYRTTHARCRVLSRYFRCWSRCCRDDVGIDTLAALTQRRKRQVIHTPVLQTGNYSRRLDVLRG